MYLFLNHDFLIFCYFSMKYMLWQTIRCISDTLQMCILSICFCGEIRKIFIWIFLFSGAMWNSLFAGRSKQTLPAHDFVELQMTLVILKFKGLSEVRDTGSLTYQICRTANHNSSRKLFLFSFSYNKVLTFHVNHLSSRCFT